MSSAAELPAEISAALVAFRKECPHLSAAHLKFFFAVALNEKATQEALLGDLQIAPATFDFLFSAMGPPRIGLAKEWQCYLIKESIEGEGLNAVRSYELTRRGSRVNIKVIGAMQQKSVAPNSPSQNLKTKIGLSRAQNRNKVG